MLAPDPETGQLFTRLLEIVAQLRAPAGCPWDREQTPQTIAPYLLEEAHEVLDAVEKGAPEDLCEELGDVLLEVALLSQMAREQDHFTAADSLRTICAKLVRRHPHVFGEAECADAEAVRESWARIKATEKRDRGVLDGVPRRLPALHRARRVSERAAGVGFDWSGPDRVLVKVEEEIAELKGALAGGQPERAAEELGDLLFAITNLGRHLGVDPEAALHGATEKFQDRFARVEQDLSARGRHPSEAGQEELETLWQRAKRDLARANSAGDGVPQPGGLANAERPPEDEVDPGTRHHQ